tara:strand:+ start:551 stop:1513 length:963 start_codon:yes stop_codon:yes gene_type:complete
MYKESKLNIGFVGCHELSWFCLKTIIQQCEKYKDNLRIVINMKENLGKKYSSFHSFENLKNEFKFKYIRTNNINDEKIIATLSKCKLDILFIIGWHKIVEKKVFASAKYCLGFHTSLLPYNRGAAPVNWQIIKGEKKGGISLFHLNEEVDTGDIISQKEFNIFTNETCKDIHEKSIVYAIKILREEWPNFRKRKLKRKSQNNEIATFNKLRKPEDGEIDWNKDSTKIRDWIRALTHPYPGAFSYLDEKKVFIYDAELVKHKGNYSPGEIIKISCKNILVACGDGVIKVKKINFEGEPLTNANIFKTLYELKKGHKFTLGK